MTRQSVLAVVPALNEQENVGRVVATLLLTKVAGTVIVVDDKSADGTARAAATAGAHVITNPGHRGKGNAVRAGLQVARGADPAYVLLVDADLGDVVREMETVLRPVEQGNADMTVAGFALSTGGGFGAALRLARWGVQQLTGQELEFPLSGQRAMRAHHLWQLVDDFGLEPGFGMEVGLAIDWLRSGHSIMEVMTEMRHVGPGRTPAGFAHRARQFAAVSAALAARTPVGPAGSVGLASSARRGGPRGGPRGGQTP